MAREQKRCFVHQVAHDFRRRLAAGNEIYRLASPQWHRGHIARGEHRRREQEISHLGVFRASLHQQYPVGKPEWWYDIVEGLPDPIVKDGFIQVDAWTRRGMGLDFNVEAARP